MALRPAKTDQPGHPPRLIKVFTVRMKKHWGLSYLLNELRRLWSDWADAQAYLSLRWTHRSYCWFCHEAAHFLPIRHLSDGSKLSQSSSKGDDQKLSVNFGRDGGKLSRLKSLPVSIYPRNPYSQKSLLCHWTLLSIINPYLPSGVCHPYIFHESISNFRGVWCTGFYFIYDRNSC